MSVFDRHRLTDTAKARYLRKLGAGIIAVSLALGGLFVAYGADCKPGDTGCNTGGSHNENNNHGNSNYTSEILWRTNDNFGPANGNTVTSVLLNNMGGQLTDRVTSTQAINATTDRARYECETKYANRHNGDRNAGCRVFAVGAVMSHPGNWVVGATGEHKQLEWLNSWYSEVNGRSYAHNGKSYSAADRDSSGTSINDFAIRETANGENTNLVVIVLAQDQPLLKVIPPAPSKEIERGISADRMNNYTHITTETGVGADSLIIRDTFNPNGLRYTVTDQSMWDLTTGQNISGSFWWNTTNGQTPAGNVLTATWNGGSKIPDNHRFQLRLAVTVDHPNINHVDDEGSVQWDSTNQYTGWKTFPTWWGTPNKAWVFWNENENRWISVADRDWTNSVGADTMAILNGSKIGSAVNSLISRDLINIPMGYQIADDYTNADYIFDPDMKDIHIYMAETNEVEKPNISDMAKNGQDVTNQFNILVENGKTIVARMKGEYLRQLQHMGKAIQYTMIIGGKANYSNGGGVEQVKKDFGNNLPRSGVFCTAPNSTELLIGSTNEPQICVYVFTAKAKEKRAVKFKFKQNGTETREEQTKISREEHIQNNTVKVKEKL